MAIAVAASCSSVRLSLSFALKRVSQMGGTSSSRGTLQTRRRRGSRCGTVIVSVLALLVVACFGCTALSNSVLKA